MKIDTTLNKILNYTKPLLYDTDYQGYEYANAGSCFLLKWQEKLYIISAKHCFKNHKVKAKDIMYPIPNSEYFLGINNQFDICSQKEYADQLILEVKLDNLSKILFNSLDIIDLSYQNSIISFDDTRIKDVYLRGFPLNNDNHTFYHEKNNKKIIQQAYLTNSFIKTRKSPYEYCYFLKMKQPTYNYIEGHDNENAKQANGMSGSPVYAIDINNNIRFAGIIIEYHKATSEYLVINAHITQELLSKAYKKE